mgnify:CR=1 FL=1
MQTEEEKINGNTETPQPPSNDVMKDQEIVEELSEVETVKKQLSECEKQTAQVKDQLLRKAAEFENYKRRMENDIATLAKFASENVITQFLPLIDDFNRSLKAGQTLSSDPFYKGVEMILSKFMKVLESQGVKTMETVGKEFNVEFHDALMQMPKEDVAPNTIIEEVEKGYFLHNKVIRHAKVIVAKEKTE